MDKDIYYFMEKPIEEGHLLCLFPYNRLGLWGKRKLRDLEGRDLGYEQFIDLDMDGGISLGMIFDPFEKSEITLEGYCLESLDETLNCERTITNV